MVREERADHDTYHHAYSHDDGHETVGLFLIDVHIFIVLCSWFGFFLRSVVWVEIYYLDASSLHEFDAVIESVFLGIYHALDARLDDEFGTLDTW